MTNADNSPQSNTSSTINPNSNSIPSSVLPHEHEELEQQRKLHLAQLYAIKFIAVLLILQGLWTLFNSIKFIFIKLPSLEQQLNTGQINNLQVNAFANRAIVMTISTILSLFFALRITIIQSKIAKIISITIAVLLVIGNTQINNFLNQIGSSQLIGSTVIETFRSVISF